jgi:hypothetical protein
MDYRLVNDRLALVADVWVLTAASSTSIVSSLSIGRRASAREGVAGAKSKLPPAGPRVFRDLDLDLSVHIDEPPSIARTFP